MINQFKPTSFRTNIVFGILVAVVVIGSSSAYVLGSKTGELNKKITQPIQNNIIGAFKTIAEVLKESKTPTINSSYSNSVNINIQNSVNITSAPTQVNINTKSIPPVKQQIVPTVHYIYRFDTPSPNPTVVQWNKDFDQKWNEMQKSQEQSLKDFCQKMPSASVCH